MATKSSVGAHRGRFSSGGFQVASSADCWSWSRLSGVCGAAQGFEYLAIEW